MFSITIFSDKMIIFSTLKNIFFAHGQVKDAFQCHVMTQIDNKNESTIRMNHVTHFINKCVTYTHIVHI